MRTMTSTLMFLLIANIAHADMFTPSHSCSNPNKPYEFQSEWQLQSFMNEVENYKNCIIDFVEEQNQEAQNPQEAAEGAIQDWNNFVQWELK